MSEKPKKRTFQIDYVVFEEDENTQSCKTYGTEFDVPDGEFCDMMMDLLNLFEGLIDECFYNRGKVKITDIQEVPYDGWEED